MSWMWSQPFSSFTESVTDIEKAEAGTYKRISQIKKDLRINKLLLYNTCKWFT